MEKIESKTPPKSYSTKEFFLDDFHRTLFPLSTNRITVENGEDYIIDYIKECKDGQMSFLQQHRVHAFKDAIHLRRTVKLDPVAEYFMYDIVFKNKSKFRKPHNDDKRHYGYRFKDGTPVSPSEDYHDFKMAVWLDYVLETSFIGFDISSYFNGLYHHDLVAWFAALNTSNEDIQIFGKYLREINAGRSVDCLPHGLYPSKMIGNDFLRFIEESLMLKSNKIRRFMDDIYIFASNQDEAYSDFIYIQGLIGLKGLSVNAAKTNTDKPNTDKTDNSISDVKKKILDKRRKIVSSSIYDQDESDVKSNFPELTQEELNEIYDILKGGNIEESDAELILTVMRKNASNILNYLPQIIISFPHLAKNVYSFCQNVEDKKLIIDILNQVISEKPEIHEYQLFWFGMMLDGYLISEKKSAILIDKLLNHKNATDISKAKILEIPDLRFGLPEIRQTYLSSGRSDWLSWASAVGSRTVKSAARNYVLEYFMKSSPMNRIIGNSVKNIQDKR